MRFFDHHEHDCGTRLRRRALCPARLRQPPTVLAQAVRQDRRCNAGRHVVLAHGRKMPRRIADFVQRVRSNSGIGRGPRGRERQPIGTVSFAGRAAGIFKRIIEGMEEAYLNLGARLALWSSSQAVANGPKSLSNSACSSASIRWRAQNSVTDQTFVSSSVSICLGSMCSVKGVSSEFRDYASPAFIRTS